MDRWLFASYNHNMDTTIAKHIEITPGVCGGKPRIAGHRITVHNIAVWHERMGWSADDIVAHYPQLSLADVHAALAYYFDHAEQINAQIDAERELAEKMASNTPSRVQELLKERKMGPDSVSS